MIPFGSVHFSSVAKSCWLFATPWITVHQASVSITNSCSLLKLMSIELVMPSNHLILCLPFFPHLQSFPASGSFQTSQLFASCGQGIGVSASASVLTMNIQDWFPLGLTGWIFLQSRDSQESSSSLQFKSINFRHSAFFTVQLSHPYVTTGKISQEELYI